MGRKARLKWLTRDMVNHEVTPEQPGLPKMLRNMKIRVRTLLRAMVRREAQYDMGTKWTEVTQKLMNMREGRNPTNRRYAGAGLSTNHGRGVQADHQASETANGVD